MKPILLLLFLFTGYFTKCIYAQKEKSFKIYPGEKASSKIPPGDLYAYPQFTDGVVYYRDNHSAQGLLNYNALTREMEFISGDDTLSLSEPGTIRYIVIQADTFYYSDGYVKRIAVPGEIKLAEKTFFAVNARRTGNESGNGFVNSNANKTVVAEVNLWETITVVKKKEWYIGDTFGNFRLLNRKSLMEAYGNRQQEVAAYIKENKIDISKEEDIKKLVNRFNTL